MFHVERCVSARVYVQKCTFEADKAFRLMGKECGDTIANPRGSSPLIRVLGGTLRLRSGQAPEAVPFPNICHEVPPVQSREKAKFGSFPRGLAESIAS